MKLCFATNNANKVKEIKNKLSQDIELVSLDEMGITEELPENQATLEGNSLEKAEYLYNTYNIDCIADDTGLEVYELDGEPGVYSARYAGPQKSPQDNMDLLLEKLKNSQDRRAQFRTIITLILNGKRRQFEGLVKGKIALEKMGGEGFGYDPIFIPNGFDKSFAQMGLEEKNQISHRAIAVNKLVDFLLKKKY